MLKLPPVLRGYTAHQSLKILAASAFNNAVSLGVTVFAARQLGPAEFGKFALAVSAATLLALALDFGLSLTLVRIYNAEPNRTEGLRMVTAVLRVKLALLLFAAALSYPVSTLIVRWGPALLAGSTDLVALAIVSGALLNLWVGVRAGEQAGGDFGTFARFTVLYGLLRLISAAVLVIAGTVTGMGVFAILYPIPLVALLGWNLAASHRSVLTPTPTDGWSAELTRLRRAATYSMWVAVSTFTFTSLSRLPQFALARRSSAVDVGLYSAALSILAFFSLLNDAVRTTLLPRVAALRTRHERRDWNRRLLELTPIVLGGLGLGVISAAGALYFVMGPAYQSSAPLFLLLGGATAVTIQLGLFTMMVHAHGIPDLDARVNVGRLLVLGLLLVVLPPNATTAAISFATVLVLGETGLYLLLRRRDVPV